MSENTNRITIEHNRIISSQSLHIISMTTASLPGTVHRAHTNTITDLIYIFLSPYHSAVK